MLMPPLVTAGVSADVAQELQMPIGPEAPGYEEEPMRSRSATLKGPGIPDHTVLGQHNLT